jgi:hypothetical protein
LSHIWGTLTEKRSAGGWLTISHPLLCLYGNNEDSAPRVPKRWCFRDEIKVPEYTS